MRKRKKGKSLSRPRSQKNALMNALASSLFLHGKIKTTEAKAKELRAISEKFVTKGKTNSLASRRALVKHLPKKTVSKLIEEIAPRYSSKRGGCIRIVKLGPRKSDGAKMAIIELMQ